MAMRSLGVGRRMQRALVNPRKIPLYLKTHFSAIGQFVREGRFGEALAYTPRIVAIDTYQPYLRWRSHGGKIEREILGNDMYLDISYPGSISTDLAIWRIRERHAVELFQRELHRLLDEVEGNITVLDVGANIGYYVLIEATVLGDRATIYGIEPDPRNVQLLEQNVAKNGFDDAVDVTCAAIGAKNSTATLYVSSRNNCNTVGAPPLGGELVDTIETDLLMLDRFVDLKGIEPTEINVIRMDIEGYEAEAIRGAERIMSSASPLVLFVELHRGPLKEKQELVPLLDKIRDYGFELVEAHTIPQMIEENVEFIDEFDDLYEGTNVLEIMLKK